ncbi:MAG: Bacterial Ig-like domain (group 2), partial [Armatimonadetes bacterium]|nr:Bacterial Ig-like domain (group 2) [Armatimonadota bacterium]
MVTPATVRLTGRYTSQALSIRTVAADGTETDVSQLAKIASSSPAVRVAPGPVVAAERDGKGALEVRFGGSVLRVPVEVRGTAAVPDYQFERDIQPILTKTGCNQGACHGKAVGQHGFKLSLLGWDHEGDWSAIAREAGARRVSRSDSANSLLLKKAAAIVPHGGGTRLDQRSPDFRIIQQWVAAGAPFGDPEAPALKSISVWPPSRVVKRGGTDRLLVTAHYSDGSQRDVTGQALYTSNDLSMATVDEAGVVTAIRAGGEAPVMVRYQGLADIARVVVPAPAPKTPFPVVAADNLIDRAIFPKLRTLNIEPSRLTTDTEFLRRVTE